MRFLFNFLVYISLRTYPFISWWILFRIEFNWTITKIHGFKQLINYIHIHKGICINIFKSVIWRCIFQCCFKICKSIYPISIFSSFLLIVFINQPSGISHGSSVAEDSISCIIKFNCHLSGTLWNFHFNVLWLSVG